MSKLHHLYKVQYILNVLVLYLRSKIYLNMGHPYYRPITKQIVFNSIDLLLHIPLSYHLDRISIDVDFDGDITVEWYKDVWSLVSLTVSDPDLYYEALIGNQSHHGRRDNAYALLHRIKDLVAELLDIKPQL